MDKSRYELAQRKITLRALHYLLHCLKQANYSNNDYYHYTYDVLGNRETQGKSILGSVTNDTYVYDDANRLTDVDGVTYTWDDNGNLIDDGVTMYTYDSANRLKTLSKPGNNVTYSYNGLGDRLRETVNGITTTFTMDLNMGLTQALSDGTNTYIYGMGRIAQTAGTGIEFFLGDALGSVRQLTNSSGVITYTKAYDPYGVVNQTIGSSQSAYGYTGEFTSNDMVYLRARFYTPNMGRFITQDTWAGNINSPMSLNLWNLATANPVNYVDPSGYFPESVLRNSLEGQTLAQVFGRKTDGVARWGLYQLLKDSESWDQFTLRIADFGYEGPGYPLKSDGEGPWTVYEHDCQLVFLNPSYGYLSLQDFMRTITHKANFTAGLSAKWWRFPSLSYHWYESNNEYYSDFYEWSDLPELLMTSGSVLPALEVASLAFIKDKYGNQYYGASVGFPFGVSFAEAWEGYASFNASERTWRTLNEGQIKDIVLGWSITGNASIISGGAGYSLWRTGTIALFGSYNASLGASLSVGYTWQDPANDMAHRWDWVEQIPRYGPP